MTDDELAALNRRRDELLADVYAYHRRDPERFPLPDGVPPEPTFMWVGDVPDDVSSLIDEVD